jgi:tetratricopeptide (TPR) repeat protein
MLAMNELLVKAMDALERKDSAAALEALESGVPAEGEEADFAYYRGICLSAAGRHADAVPYLEQVIADAPRRGRARQARLLIAYGALRLEDPRTADYELERYVEDFGATAQVLSMRGYSALLRGSTNDALAFYRKALDIDPRHATALNAAGYILSHTGEDPWKALSYCRRALESDPSNPAYLDSLGWTLCRMGHKDRGRVFIERAFMADPGSEDIKRHLDTLKEGEQ